MVKYIIREVDNDTSAIAMSVMEQGASNVVSVKVDDYNLGGFIKALTQGMGSSVIILSDNVQVPVNFHEKATGIIMSYGSDIISFKHDLDTGMSGLHSLGEFGRADALYIPLEVVEFMIDYYHNNMFTAQHDPVVFIKSYLNNQGKSFIASHPEMVVVDND